MRRGGICKGNCYEKQIVQGSASLELIYLVKFKINYYDKSINWLIGPFIKSFSAMGQV
mgnify:CR=1 FL=1